MPHKIPVTKLKQVQRCALALPDSDRATLAAELLISLPVVLVDEDDGIAEARRRSKELDEDPAAGMFMGRDQASISAVIDGSHLSPRDFVTGTA